MLDLPILVKGNSTKLLAMPERGRPIGSSLKQNDICFSFID